MTIEDHGFMLCKKCRQQKSIKDMAVRNDCVSGLRKICKECSNVYRRSKYRIYYKRKTNRIYTPVKPKKCEYCEEIFKPRLSSRIVKYCSRKCCGKARSLLQMRERNPSWRGGVILNGGYRYILTPNHPYTNKLGYVAEHRLVMEKSIGRYLISPEVVHHKNNKRHDNSLDNLRLFKNSNEHIKWHNKQRKGLVNEQQF